MDKRIEELRGLCERATAGPWMFEITHYPDGTYRIGNNEYVLGKEMFREDAEFIKYARTAVPELLDEIELLTAQLAAAQKERDAVKHRTTPCCDCFEFNNGTCSRTKLRVEDNDYCSYGAPAETAPDGAEGEKHDTGDKNGACSTHDHRGA